MPDKSTVFKAVAVSFWLLVLIAGIYTAVHAFAESFWLTAHNLSIGIVVAAGSVAAIYAEIHLGNGTGVGAGAHIRAHMCLAFFYALMGCFLMEACPESEEALLWIARCVGFIGWALAGGHAVWSCCKPDTSVGAREPLRPQSAGRYEDQALEVVHPKDQRPYEPRISNVSNFPAAEERFAAPAMPTMNDSEPNPFANPAGDRPADVAKNNAPKAAGMCPDIPMYDPS